MSDQDLRPLMVMIAEGNVSGARKALRDRPSLATATLERDATRLDPAPPIVQRLSCYFYKGDSALHIAAAAHRTSLVRLLLELGCDPGTANRRGTTALHCAAAGAPESPSYDPKAQCEAIALLIAAGADPEAANRDGATPLHRAVRSRCAAAVDALLKAGASPTRTNRSGSSPMVLAVQSSGRGGSGLPAPKREHARIIRLLESAAR